jgi:hypothetical protein
MGTFVENVNKLATDLTTGLKLAINTVSTNIASVVVVSDNMPDVVSVADAVVPNMAEILLADTNAATATTKAAEALASANAAAISETNAAAAYDSFDDRYLGAKASEPTMDNDGGVLLIGALYFDTVNNSLRVWSGTVWELPLNTLTEASNGTLTNKTLDSISNTVGANHIHYPIRNVSGSTITAGTVVTAQGTQSGTDYVEVVPVTDPQTQVALGIMHNTVSNNGTGLCMNTGVSTDVINTSGWTVGTILYPNASGGLTATKPASGRYQACAVVLRSHATQGTMLIEFTEPKYLASTTLSGYVQLNNTLTSTSTTQALTAAQGKALQDSKQNTLTLDAVPTDGSTNVVSSNGVFDALANKADTSALSSYLAKAGGTMTGAITALAETRVAMGANAIDLTAGNLFTKTISGATTLTVSGWLATGNANSFVLELTNGGSAVVTWFAGVKWAGGSAPTLTATGVDILGFYSHDGGTTVRGILLAKDSK